jgi:hypothetical protein
MPFPRRAKKASKIGAAASVEARKRPAISTQPEESSKVSKGLEEEEEEEDYKFECRHLRIERFQLVQENGRLAQSNAAHELKVRALSQDVAMLEVTNDGSLLWDSLTLAKLDKANLERLQEDSKRTNFKNEQTLRDFTQTKAQLVCSQNFVFCNLILLIDRAGRSDRTGKN